MYGDNLICGKISDLAKRSFFDLTNGEFVLGDNGDGTAALKYVNGVLTIGGIPDENTIKQLILDMNSNTNIGGENIIPDSDEMIVSPPMSYPVSEFILNPHQDADNFIAIKAGTYVFSAENAKCLWYAYKYGSNYSESIPFNYYLKATFTDGTYSDVTPVTTVQNSAIKDIVFTLEREAVISLVVSYNPSEIPEDDHSIVEKVQITLTNMMLQRGNKSTSYQRYVKHLTDAFGVPTEIMGGVIATSLIMLRNEKGEVVAGMSGMTDNNPNGKYGDGTFSHGVHSWAGGSYDDALKQAMGLVENLQKMLPILFTKTGFESKIGCFTVIDRNSVKVENPDKTERILVSVNDGILFQKRDNISSEYTDCISISPKKVDLTVKESSAEIVSSSKSNARLNNSVIFSTSVIDEGYYYASIDSGCTIDVTLNRGFTEAGQYGIVDVWIASEASDDWTGENVYLLCENKTFYTLGYTSTTIRISGLSSSTNRMYLKGEVHLCIRFKKVVEIYAEEEYDITSTVSATVKLNKSISLISSNRNQVIKIGPNGMVLSSSPANTVIFDLEKGYTSVCMRGLPTAANKPTENGVLYEDNGVIKIV
jgi:hypothetical protein